MLEKILGKEIAQYVRAHRGMMMLSLFFAAATALFMAIPLMLMQPFFDEGMKTGNDPTSWKISWVKIEWGGAPRLPERTNTISSQAGAEFESKNRTGPATAKPKKIYSFLFFKIQRTEWVLVKNIHPNRLLILLAVIAFFANLIKSITLYFSELTAATFSNRAIKSVRIALFQKFLSLPLSYYHKSKIGELISRSTSDLTIMQERIANILIGLVQHPIMILLYLGGLLILDYRLTLLTFIGAPLIIGLIRLFGRKVKKHATRVQDAVSFVTGAYQENLLCLKVVQGFTAEKRESGKFKVLVEQFYKKVMHWNRWFLGLGPMMDSIVFLALGVLLIGKISFGHTLGELITIFYAFSRVYAPVKSLARVNTELRTLQGATARVFGILNAEPEIRDRSAAVSLARHKKAIEFEKVVFGYDRERPVLQEVTFQIQAGRMAAFVGSTGAGKSTLLDLIPRFYDVQQGAIRIDGVDIREVTLASLRSQIGIVNQEVLLFHDTIANNIRYGAPGKSMEEITAAAKAAHAHDFILAQPQGYESIVGDRGTLLSGGQRQRIAIARAILVNPAILLLDEAASALDAESENLVQEAIFRLRGGRTILVVAHRLSTIREADCIFVLEAGRILEQGTHAELLTLNGRYRQLHDMQFRA